MSLPPGSSALIAVVAAGLVLVAVGTPITAALWLALSLAFLGWQTLRQREALARWAEGWAHGQPQPLPEGRGRWRSIFERLTRHTREEDAQRAAAIAEIAKLRVVVDLLPDALVVLDRDNQVQWLNRAATDLLGPMIAQRPVSHFIREPEFLRYLEGADFKTGITLPLANHPGKLFSVRVVPTTDPWYLLILHDVTQQHRVEAMRSDFVANVSHEIRTPLTVVSGFIDTLIDLDLPREQSLQHLRAARKHSATMERLLTDLLTLSGLESTAPSDNQPFALRPLLTAQAADARALSGGRHRISTQASCDVELIGSTSEIETALRNLLTNAIRYTPEGGSITVTLEQDLASGGATVSVIDTGIGIGREHLPRLAERFYRVDRGRSRVTGGTGLGLAIVKHVAQRHDAQLQIESTPGRGSRFSIHLPASRARPRAIDPPRGEAATPAIDPPRGEAATPATSHPAD